MKYFRVIMFLTFFAITACVPRMTTSQIETSFKKEKDIATEDQLERYNLAILQYESGGRRLSGPKGQLVGLISENMTESAMFVVENDLLRGDPRNEYYTEKALKLLIKNGHYEFIDDYWNAYCRRQNSGANVYSYDFIRSAMCYIAKKSPQTVYGDYSYRVLVEDWSRTAPEQSAKWFAKYVKNNKIKRDNQTDLAFKIAKSFFESRDYDIAAGWYLAGINLSDKDEVEMSKESTLDVLQQVFSYYLTFDEALEQAVEIETRISTHETQNAIKRLEHIKAAGVESHQFFNPNAIENIE